jgi:hypothetical protein
MSYCDRVTHKERIREIEDRLVAALVISIFLPSFLVTLQLPNDAVITWSVLAGLYVACLFFFELAKWRLRNDFLVVVDWTALLGLGTFILPLILYSAYINKPVYPVVAVFNQVSLFLMPIMPIFALGFVLGGAITSLRHSRHAQDA